MAKKKRGQKRPVKKGGGKLKRVAGVRSEAESDEWAGLGLKPKQRALLGAYAECGSLRKAALAADVARSNHTKWLKSSDSYAKAFKVAEEVACQVLEDEARRRAVEGVEEPIYYQGVRVGHRQVRSDVLLMFLLKGANPDKYRDRADVTHRGDKEHPIPVDMNMGQELLRKMLELAVKPGVPGIGGGS
jgi:hypothetical protein